MAEPAKPRRVTAADVARSLGLSRATVGFVLNNTPGQTIPPATRARVLAEANRLGYRPHSAARALASGKSRIILLVLPDWPRDYSLQTNLDEASAALDDAGYSLVTMTRRAGGHAQPLWETLAPDVVIAAMPLTADEFERIRASGVEHILAQLGEATDDFDLGYQDGPRLQVEHLVERRRRAIAFAASGDARLADLSRQRFERADETHRALRGTPLAASGVVTAETAETVVAGWLREGVDGVVAYNDDTAAIVASAALRLGTRIPDQLAIIGHDDAPIASLFVPSLSSVRVDSGGLGRYLAALALNAVEPSPSALEAPTVTVSLAVRESS